MNEYISDGTNGLLYRDIRTPELRRGVDIATLRRRAADESAAMASLWKSQLNELLRQHHPYHYSPALRSLRAHGVTFVKHFDFNVPIDPIGT